MTDDLFRIVDPAALYDRPIPERHRIVFYVGHLEAFDLNLFSSQLGGLESSQPEFDRLFAFGIDPVGGGLPNDQPADWPALAVIQRYNSRVRQQLDRLLESGTASDAKSNGQVLLNVAIEHRLMHAETLAYMLHRLPLDRKIPQRPQRIDPAPAAPPISPRLIDIPAGKATLGLARRSGGFGWDNEFDVHEVDVPAFGVDETKVTNAQFLDFVRAGGYQERSLWSDEGWDWIQHEGVRHPGFWTERDGRWFHRSMFAEAPLPEAWPVYLSHAEASAFARWKGRKLPSEAQFHRAAYGTPEGSDGSEREYPWGGQPPGAARGNFDFQRWDPTPAAAHPAGRSAFGVTDLVGNGWEWTSTRFAPFAGFEPFPFYPGYSANFFDGKHYVMKGGSARTAACMLRRSFRNWFQAHYPYIYTGFRTVLD